MRLHCNLGDNEYSVYSGTAGQARLASIQVGYPDTNTSLQNTISIPRSSRPLQGWELRHSRPQPLTLTSTRTLYADAIQRAMATWPIDNNLAF